MVMSENEVNRIVNNDREWRKHIFRTMEKIEKKQDLFDEKQTEMALEMNTLKVKVAIFSSSFGALFGGLFAWLMGKVQ